METFGVRDVEMMAGRGRGRGAFKARSQVEAKGDI